MKNLFLNITLLFSCSLLSFAQVSTHQEVGCDSKEITFYDNVDFMYNTKSLIIIPKRDGVNSYKYLSEKKIKRLKKEAKKYKCCMVICDFNYQTPKALKVFDQEEQDEKKNYFYFHISKKIEKIGE